MGRQHLVGTRQTSGTAQSFPDIRSTTDANNIRVVVSTARMLYSNDHLITPLFVKLVSFHVEKKNDRIALLTWHTASKLNNYGFDIQRSSDGRDWETLGFVPGNGTTHEEQSYTYTDSRPLPGINYYRLKQMDFDGKMEYSDVRSVVMENGTNGGVAVYPNPVKDVLLNVDFATEQEGAATLRIFDASGKLLHREVLASQYNQTGYGHLPAGIYFIEVTSSQDVWRERLIVQ